MIVGGGRGTCASPLSTHLTFSPGTPCPSARKVTRSGGRAGAGAQVCAPKMAQPDFLYWKFRFFPRWSLWCGGRGGTPFLLQCTAILRLAPRKPQKKNICCTTHLVFLQTNKFKSHANAGLFSGKAAWAALLSWLFPQMALGVPGSNDSTRIGGWDPVCRILCVGSCV